MIKPRVNSESQNQLNKADEEFKEFSKQVEAFNPIEVKAPLEEREQQTKLSTREMKNTDAPYIKPMRNVARVNTKERPTFWDEKHRPAHDRDWEYVKITAENNELIGSMIEMWTAEYGCDPAHFWQIPVNRPIYVPRLVAKKIAGCKYHRMSMETADLNNTKLHEGENMQFVGGMVATHTKHRLNAYPVGDSFTSKV
jgi:hypothetical protein